MFKRQWNHAADRCVPMASCLLVPEFQLAVFCIYFVRTGKFSVLQVANVSSPFSRLSGLCSTVGIACFLLPRRSGKTM